MWHTSSAALHGCGTKIRAAWANKSLFPTLRRMRSGRSSKLRKGTAANSQDEAAIFKALIHANDSKADPETLNTIQRLKLGKQTKSFNPKFSSNQRKFVCSSSFVGVMRSHREPTPSLPIPNQIPEIAIAGRSNVGKSSLLNALTGLKPGWGDAPTSHHAGWTRSVNFYAMFEAFESQKTVLTLADLPGYGPVETVPERESQTWKKLSKRYLREREQLACVFVLVESAIGISEYDFEFMSQLDRLNRPFQVIMTKADALTPRELAVSNELIFDAVKQNHPTFQGYDIPMCSSRHGTGVVELWERLRAGMRLASSKCDESSD